MPWLYICVIASALFLFFIHDYQLSGDIQEHAVVESEVTTRILFSGDVFLGRDVERRNTGKYTILPLQIFTEFPDRDAIVINFESAVPLVHVPTPDFGMQFSVAPRFVKALSTVGITHASLANNHALDHGDHGYENTRQELTVHNITPFGHPRQVRPDSVSYVRSPSQTIAIVALHTLFSSPTIPDITALLDEVKKEADFVIAYVHWGTEYELVHSQTQERFAQQLVDIGFDLIIGHHPHVVQGIHVMKGVPVVYSLGNTIFDQYFSRDVQEGLLVELELGDDNQLSLYPITSIDTPTRPRLMSSEEAVEWLEQLAARSDPRIRDEIRTGHIRWTNSLRNQ